MFFKEQTVQILVILRLISFEHIQYVPLPTFTPAAVEIYSNAQPHLGIQPVFVVVQFATLRIKHNVVQTIFLFLRGHALSYVEVEYFRPSEKPFSDGLPINET